MNSMDLLIEKINCKKNPTVAGLDPKLDFIPKYIVDEAFEKYGRNLKGASQAIWEFNKGLIDSLYDIVPAVKPQSAYYEAYGPAGVQILADTIDYAKQKGLYVITDVKRNDIGATAKAYADAYIGETRICDGVSEKAFDSDSVTVNPYLGTDGIKPFLRSGKSIFVLVKTSNPSSGELQDKLIGDKTVYRHIAELVKEWGSDYIGESGYSNAGAVVGATYPSQLEELRTAMPNTYFLVPGYGAQGGKAADAAKAFDDNGFGAIINASRSIMCAYQKNGTDEKDYAAAAREEAIKMRNELCSYI